MCQVSARLVERDRVGVVMKSKIDRNLCSLARLVVFCDFDCAMILRVLYMSVKRENGASKRSARLVYYDY